MSNRLDAHVFIIFGATGDLTRRLILPALYDLSLQPEAEGRFVMLGVGRGAQEEQAFRTELASALGTFAGLTKTKANRWVKKFVFYEGLVGESVSDYTRVRERADALAQEHGLGGNRVLYLAIPPSAFEEAVEKIGKSGMHRSDGWTRVVVEKPFGEDLKSARSLNSLLHRYFDEDDIYRIDHFLGKTLVQNLLVFRFGNPIFERHWNRDHIEQIEVLVPEDLDVGTRAGYYDHAGALRDMIQNHLIQLLTLVAMEVPVSPEGNDIRLEKIKVLRSILPIEGKNVVFGQYTAGEIEGRKVEAYRKAKGVAKDSDTETFVALKLEINNWRWQGIPFVLMTGKALKRRFTYIRVRFRHAPVSFFQSYERCHLHPNVLLIKLSPDEGFSLYFEVKRPGEGYVVETQKLSFDYAEAFGEPPSAYRTLVEEVIRGDGGLFVHAEEAEESWKLFDPVIKPRRNVYPYSAGTWGPKEAGKLLDLDALDGC